jgi:hypothetical protein
MAGRKGETGRKNVASGSLNSPAAALTGDSGKGNNKFLSGFVKNYSLSIIIFLFSLFVIITVSSPALFINDEWITANQLHQLNIGHQITINEGKYY